MKSINPMKSMKLIIAFIFAFACATTFAQTEKEKVESTITKSKIEGHIYFLADDVLKGRETGTPENKIAAAYLANTLRSYGVKPNPITGTYYQPVYLEKVSPPTLKELTVNKTVLKDFVVMDVAPINYNQPAVFMGYGLEADYKDKDVKGKVVLIKAGSSETTDAQGAFRMVSQKREAAQKAGAIGIVELLDVQEQMWGFIDHNFNASSLKVATNETADTQAKLPFIWVKDTNGSMLAEIEKNKINELTLALGDSEKSKITSQNVIGVVEGTDPKLKNEYIIYSAHYDHVGIGTPDETGDTIYNGARDNAVGTTTVLSMAESLAKYPTKRSALFILFTGEEKGLLGSEYYVDNPVLPLNQMVYCFNSDNAGYNDTSKATIIGLPRTTAANHIKKAATIFGLTAVDDPAPEQGLFDRSDNVHFAAKGIPAPTFSLGFNSFDGDVTKYYHRPGDEADTLDYDYLLKFFRAYVMAGRTIANDAVTPVWTAGDKYEEAGEKLYQTKVQKK
jgi:aminopeptidase YwaD